MQGSTYKVWTSLTEPIVIKGVTLDYGAFLIISSSIAQVWLQFLPFNEFYLVIPYFIGGYIYGVVKGRQDRRWFRVLCVGFVHYNIKPLSRWKYVS